MREGSIPSTNSSTKVHRCVVNARDNRDILLGNKSLDGDLGSCLVESPTYAYKSLCCDERSFVGVVSVHVHQIDHQALSKNAQWNTDEDEDLAALGILHEYTYEDGGNLECHTESIAR